MKITCLRHVGFGTLALLLTTVACGGSSSPPGDGGLTEDGGSRALGASDGASPTPPGVCTFPAPLDTPQTQTCPSGCEAIKGLQLDAASGKCVRRVLIGCLDCANGCGGGTGGSVCYKSLVDQRLVFTVPYATQGKTEWASCTPAETDLFLKPTFCAD